MIQNSTNKIINFSRPNSPNSIDIMQSLYFKLRPYKILNQKHYRSPSLKEQNNTNKQRQNRRKSCYCSECGSLTTFQQNLLIRPANHQQNRSIVKNITIQANFIKNEQQKNNSNSPFLKKNKSAKILKTLSIGIIPRMRNSLILECKDFHKTDQALPSITFQTSTLTRITTEIGQQSKKSSIQPISQRTTLSVQSQSPQKQRFKNIYLSPIKVKNGSKSQRIISKPFVKSINQG